MADQSRTITARQDGNGAAIRTMLGSLGDALFVAPVVILVLGVILVPAGLVIAHSFTAWNPGGASPFVGFANYTELFNSQPFQQIMKNEAFFLLGVPLWTLLPMVIALMLYDRVPAPGLFRTIFFFPSVLAPAIVGILFRSLLGSAGFVNAVLHDLGLGFLALNWLSSPGLVKPVLIVLLAWAGLGTGVVIFSASLSAVPPELFEAAELDGASFWRKLWHVMLPGTRGTVELWILYQVLTVFLWLFAWIYVLTAGGPGYSSTTLDYDIYQNALNYGFFGIAAAESVVLLAIVILIVVAGGHITHRARKQWS